MEGTFLSNTALNITDIGVIIAYFIFILIFGIYVSNTFSKSFYRRKKKKKIEKLSVNSNWYSVLKKSGLYFLQKQN